MILCPLPLNCSDTYGTLTIASVSLHLGAWCAFDLSALFSSWEPRGENVQVEHLFGRDAQTMLTAETELSLPMMFSGAVNSAGVAWANPAGGLHANRLAFEAALVNPIRAATATLPATLELPDPDDPLLTDSYTINVQPLGLLGWTLLPGGYARTVLRLRIPKPVWVAA